MRIRRQGLLAALAPIVFGSVAAVVIGHAPTPSPRPADGLAANLVASRSPVIVDCAGKTQVHPASLMLACDDGNAYLSGLRWASWGSTAAATGTWRVNDCIPNCAAGTFHTFPATVRLWRVQPLPRHPGVDSYSKIIITLPDGHCYTAGGRRGCYPARYIGTLRSTPVSR